MNFNLFELLHFIILLNNCLCQNFFFEPLQKIKVEIPKTQWQFLQSEFNQNYLDIYGFRYLPQSVVIEAGASALGEESLEVAEIPFSIIETDLHEAIEKDFNETKNNPGILNGSITFQRTLHYDEILSYLKEITKKSTKYRRISVENIGKSFEKRDIKMVKIEHPLAKNIMFFDAGIHGREWITVMTALHLITRLIQAAPNDDINYMNWYIIPCVNPDGFIYSHKHFGFYRGNRNVTGCPDSCSVCGVDLNKNFGYKWGSDGLTPNNCSFTNPGSHPFSEPESKALAETLGEYADDIKLYISMHSYGCYFRLPWSYKKEPCKDSKDLIKAVTHTAALMNTFIGSSQCKFDVQTTAIIPSSGSSEDYAKGVLDIKYVYAMYLQGGGRSGFHPNEIEIQNYVLQNYAGIRDISRYINTRMERSSNKRSRRYYEHPPKKAKESGCRENYQFDCLLYVMLCIVTVLT